MHVSGLQSMQVQLDVSHPRSGSKYGHTTLALILLFCWNVVIP